MPIDAYQANFTLYEISREGQHTARATFAYLHDALTMYRIAAGARLDGVDIELAQKARIIETTKASGEQRA